MLPVLNKLFARSFYRVNTGFFLFFFFLFFGAVEGSSLVSYHLSLMNSILRSATIMWLIFGCWILYHLKCTVYFLKIINSNEGSFLLSLQAVSRRTQWVLFTLLYAAVYAPVLVYSLVLAFVGFSKGEFSSAASILMFQALSLFFFTSVVTYRLNHWPEKSGFPLIRLPWQKNELLYVFFLFTHERKLFFLLLKTFSILLLYLVLVWNKGRYDNDAFLLFYLVLFLAHAAIPYIAVQFWEKAFAVYRNLPISLGRRGLNFLLSYFLLVLPEMIYILYHAGAFSMETRLAYCTNLLAGLALLTAMQYSGAESREEYLKATFVLVLLSIFVLHVQAFWFWIVAQFSIAAVLFASGYYRFEKKDDQRTGEIQ
jgi:hypothetical protein